MARNRADFVRFGLLYSKTGEPNPIIIYKYNIFCLLFDDFFASYILENKGYFNFRIFEQKALFFVAFFCRFSYYI
jgi:hypothetical protein